MSAKSSGCYINCSVGNMAFIPNPLPPAIKWQPNLINTLSSADHLLGRLAGEGGKLPNPHILIRPFIAREAVLSSRIEGTQTTLGELLAQEAGAQVESNPEDLLEVTNYVTALEHGIKRLSTLPLSLRLLKELHKILMRGTRGQHATPGEFRKTQNWIGPPGSTLDSARYVPPPPVEMLSCLDELEKFLHERTLPPLVQIALAHYQFEAIHPFLDGNGRVGRLLITLFLVERGLLPAPLLYLSAFFEASRHDYYTKLLNVSQKNSWEEWLNYFLLGVARQAEDSLLRAERINSLLNKWRESLVRSSSPIPTQIINYLAGNPFLTVTKVSNQLGVAFTSIQRAINKLEKLRIISQVGNVKRNRVYCANALLAILEEPARL